MTLSNKQIVARLEAFLDDDTILVTSDVGDMIVDLQNDIGADVTLPDGPVAIWTGTFNADYGITTLIYTSQAQADNDAIEYLADYWEKHFADDKPMPDAWEAAQEILLNESSFVHDVQIEKHEVLL